MLRAALTFVVLALVAPAATPASAADGATCSLNRYADIDMTVTDDGITFPVMLGEMPATGVLDLKNAFSTTTSRVAEEYDLTVRSLGNRFEIATEDGVIRTYARGFSLVIGSALFTWTAERSGLEWIRSPT